MAVGKIVGYVRVSSADQNPDRQIDSINEFVAKEYDCEPYKLYIDKRSGKDADRPQLHAVDEFLREDDVVVIHSPDRLARSARDLLEILDKWARRGVVVRFVTQPALDQGQPTGKLVLGILAVIAEFERDLIRERQAEGIAAAKARGVYEVKPKLDADQVADIRAKRAAGVSRKRLADDYGVSTTTIHNVVVGRGVYAGHGV